VSTTPFIAARIEEVLDRRAEAFFRALGWRERVICYTGYGSSGFVRVLGRVVLTPRWSRSQLGRVTEGFVRRRGWRNFFTAPCVRAKATITIGERTVEVTTDRGGYLDHRIRDHGLPPGWGTAILQTARSKPAEAELLVIGDEVRFGMISDLDDTVLTTWLPRPMIAFWNSFVRDESNRQSIPGMARMYSECLGRHPGAPLFYLSTGAWNTHDFLKRFLKRHAYPHGPMLLTDWGPTNTGWFRSGQAHKRASLLQLAAEFPQVSWLLVGDDGQHDPEIYTEFAKQRPENVRAIAIRQLSPAEQVLAHGTPGALEEPAPERADVPWVEAPDGRGLAAQLRPLFAAD
jgi:phosphatidate phosphatase APP1